METDSMTESQQQQQAGAVKAGSGYRPRGRAWAALEALVVAVVSPLAPLAPKRFAGWFSQHPVLVPAWQIGLLLSYAAYEVSQDLSNMSHGPTPLLLMTILVPYALVLGLTFLIAAYMTRPISSAWDETARWSFWKSGLLVAAFGMPLPVAMGIINMLLEQYAFGSPNTSNGFAGMHRFSVLMAANLTMVCGAMIQMVRGLASAGGKTPTDLPPMCRECGYSLEGVVELYRQNREAGEAASMVCSECGVELAVSLELSARPGTAWTRGECLGFGLWLRTLGQVLGRPGRFFTVLPLDSSRKAALWFWLGSLALTLVLVMAVLAADRAICTGTEIASPLLPVRQGHADTAPPSLGVVSLSLVDSTILWLLECFRTVIGVLLAIAGASLLVLSLSANQITRLMGKHRSMNLYPAGLLLMGYLSPAVLGIGVAVLAIGMAARLAGEAFLSDLPVLRIYVDSPEVLAVMVGLVALILGLAWFHLVSRWVTRSIRYANR